MNMQTTAKIIKTRMQLLPVMLAALSLILGLPHTARAQTQYTWTGATSSFWGTAANWSTAVAPTNGTSNSRLNVKNGANDELVYNAGEGTTTYNSSGRALLVYSNTMVIAVTIMERVEFIASP